MKLNEVEREDLAIYLCEHISQMEEPENFKKFSEFIAAMIFDWELSDKYGDHTQRSIEDLSERR